MAKKVVLAGACRTAIGTMGGGLSTTPAPVLGSIVIKEALNRAGVPADKVDHVYMGTDVKDKNIIVVDDMIASGSSMIEVATELKKRGANKIFLVATFSLFTEGIELFKEAYENKLFDKLYSTNLSYVREDVRNSSWYHEVDCSNFIAKVIHTLHKGESIEPLQNGKKEMIRKINKKVGK